MIIALIPARAGSKRVLDKNMRKVGNHTLIQWAILAAQSSRCDAVYVSTDDEKYLDHAQKSGARAFMRDPAAATDDATDRSVITDFLGRVNDTSNVKMIVYLRPSTPLRPFFSIDEAINTMIKTPNATGLRSVHEMSESALKCFVMARGNMLETMTFAPGINSRDIDRANLPNHMYTPTWKPNGVVDIVRPEIVEQPKKTYGNSVIAHITKPVIEIDTNWDLKMVNMQLAMDQDLPAEIWRIS